MASTRFRTLSDVEGRFATLVSPGQARADVGFVVLGQLRAKRLYRDGLLRPTHLSG